MVLRASGEEDTLGTELSVFSQEAGSLNQGEQRPEAAEGEENRPHYDGKPEDGLRPASQPEARNHGENEREEAHIAVGALHTERGCEAPVGRE